VAVHGPANIPGLHDGAEQWAHVWLFSKNDPGLHEKSQCAPQAKSPEGTAQSWQALSCTPKHSLAYRPGPQVTFEHCAQADPFLKKPWAHAKLHLLSVQASALGTSWHSAHVESWVSRHGVA
jgi:hypothetical protein